jgi:transposase-like protein
MENKALQCPKCSGKEITKRGLRITESREKIQKYFCKTCKHRFVIMTNQIKASFNVDEKLWDDFKIWCIKNKVTMTEKLEELVKEVLKK